MKKFILVSLLTILTISFNASTKSNITIATANDMYLKNTVDNNSNVTTLSNIDDVTPENYKEALAEYKKNNPNKFNESNPSSILEDFMKEYDLDYITVSNFN